MRRKRRERKEAPDLYRKVINVNPAVIDIVVVAFTPLSKQEYPHTVGIPVKVIP